MLNQNKHRVILAESLKAIYADRDLRTLLGFKGGTAAMFFYNLPRLSIDLDFNLLDETKKGFVLKKMTEILTKIGKVNKATEKRFTLFFLVSYLKGLRQLKIEISKRKGSEKFDLQSFLGVSVMVMDKPDMLAGKLSALITRKNFAMRDVFDTWFFLKEMWDVNESVFREKTGMTTKRAISEAIKRIEKVKKNEVLFGLGELLGSEKQKDWVREKLIPETIFHLKLMRENL